MLPTCDTRVVERPVTAEAYALLEVVHDFGSAGTGTDTAAADLSAGPPWFGLREAAEELEAAGLIDIDRMTTSAVPEPGAGSEPSASVYFLAVTDQGRALVQQRR
jgi:hypothetical protein